MTRWRWSLVVPVLALAFASASAPAPGADVESGRKKAERCAACHGTNGNATIPGTPSLAGMPVFYTHWQLIMYRDGRRRDRRCRPSESTSATRTWQTWPRTTPPSRRDDGPPRSTPPAPRPDGRWRRRSIAPPATVPASWGSRRCRGWPGRLRLPPQAPQRLQGEDDQRPRRHDDHGGPAPDRHRRREPHALHGEPRG